MLEAVPYKVHTILTDNGIQFAEQPRNRNTIYAAAHINAISTRIRRFGAVCVEESRSMLVIVGKKNGKIKGLVSKSLKYFGFRNRWFFGS